MSKKTIKQSTQGFSQKAFVFGKDGKFLTLRRTKTAPSNPLKWDLPGGDVDFGENPQKAMSREIKEESNLIAKNLKVFDVAATIDSKGEYWVTAAYRGDIAKGKLKISWEHDLYKWVSVNEFLKLRISKKLRRFAETLKQSK